MSEFAEKLAALRERFNEEADPWEFTDALMQFASDKATRTTQADLLRFLAARLEGPDKAGKFRPTHEAVAGKRRATTDLIRRACGLVAAQRLDLTGLGVDDLERLAVIVRHLEGKFTTERNKRRRGDTWS